MARRGKLPRGVLPGRATRRHPVRIVHLGLLDTAIGAGAGGDLRLRQAAEIIGNRAIELAATWSKSVPPSIRLSVGKTEAIIAARAPAARPAELRLMHPLFGDREHWYGPPGRPFLSPAANQSIDKAFEKYIEKINDWARADGFH